MIYYDNLSLVTIIFNLKTNHMDLQKRLDQVMYRSKVDFNKLDLISGKNWKQKLLYYCKMNFFLKPYQEIIKENLAIKEDVMTSVFGFNFCPFEHMTDMNWEKMYRAAVGHHDAINHSYKMINGWFHILTSSDQYSTKQNFIFSKDLLREPITLKFLYTGQEFVELDGKQYAYGEGKIYLDKLPYKKYEFHLTINHPTIIFDAAIIPIMQKQESYRKVIRLIHILYHVTSHDGLLHSVFMETDPKVRSLIAKDTFLKNMLNQYYFCYDTFEIAYVRFMRQIFDLAVDLNPNFEKEIMDIVGKIHQLTADWPELAKDYVQFISHERLSRIVPIDSSPFPKFVGSWSLLNNYVINPAGNYLTEMTHIAPHMEGVIHNDAGNVAEIPWGLIAKRMHFMQIMYN